MDFRVVADAEWKKLYYKIITMTLKLLGALQVPPIQSFTTEKRALSMQQMEDIIRLYNYLIAEAP